ncbi:MAG: hypothetical protein MI920_00825, partial [Kiloniellales bacterium]|nr:hypothetical protein [Kiloniellales bacterium]
MSASDLYQQHSQIREIPEDSTVTQDFDEKSWDMAGSLALSPQLSTGRTLLKLAESGHDDIVVCTADLGRPTQVIDFGKRYPERYFN